MTKLLVDGKEIDAPPEYTLLQACELAGAEIPRFCFHERLSIAGNCRMCLIEVAGIPKPQASCAMAVRDLMPNKDGSPKVLSTAPQAARSLSHLKKLVDERKIDLVITDFEPLTCHVGHKKKLPVISIDNQHCLTNAEVSYPRKYRRDAAAAKLVTRLMTPHANAYLVISFFTAPVRKRNTSLFPPLLRDEILQATPTQGDHVLVYVTSPAPALAKLLSSVRCRFIAYGFGREGNEGNIIYKKPSLDGFFADLTSARAVVANSGFSLVSEALHLRKPYLAVPVSHQFEQIFNAYWLEKSGYGAYWEELNKERVESFLYNQPHYRDCLANYPRQGNGALLEKLDSLIAQHTMA